MNSATEPKHTPGPWRDVAPPILCEKGSQFKVIDDKYRVIRGGKGYFDSENPVAGFCVSGFIAPENARVLAAAPALLEALDRLIQSISTREDQHGERFDPAILHACAVGEAAISLAKGEPL
jgi:hypothetical protein